MNKTIGVLAHVDAGKTTFCEQLLYHTKSIRNRGRVDNKDTFLDNHEIERQRGITIFSEQGKFIYNNSNYNLIDTPGHIDFSPDMERAISIMDYAIVIISAVEKIQPHTKTVFRLLKKHNIPVFFFGNKIDREGANIEKLIEDIKLNLSEDVIDISINLNIDNEINLSEEIIEFIAERDEELLDKYLNGEYDKELWINKLIKSIKNCDIYPFFKGSALQDIGIEDFIKKLDYLTYTNYQGNNNFIGKVYKVRYDENKNRLTYIKAISGNLKVKDELKYIIKDEVITEKINNIRVYNSNKYENVNEVFAGQIFAVTGLTNIKPNEYILDKNLDINKFYENYSIDKEIDIVPTLKSKIKFDESLNIKEVLNVFKILNDEEPALNVKWNENLKEVHIHVMGKIQLEILKEIVKNRFNIDVDFGKCEILYKETLKVKTIGYGHFEPLGHYAEVHLLIEPSTRNSGIIFKSNAHVDDLTIGHQNLIKTHIFEKEHNGILGGYPLTDINITLITGRAHTKHTSGGDFRQATLRALRQGLEQVDNLLLEPFYKFKIDIGIDYIGRVLSDIQKMSGTFKDPIISEETCIIEGRGPVSTFMDYQLELISFSKGTGSISFIFDGYDECHNRDEILENRNYDKDSDSEYTSNSIFCSKGQGYIVKGREAKEYMHCLK
ncbi:TetM/TetW/TetO/TetS family tetracycline resistance ribosomal protection protein [Paeniclostridium sp. NSJ-45]|uniref:TetM/TetW/TetO/TetS family tetracycline resistance ribosomal protection protein n=1 Tax=Paeniclostridium hominis TaxID=2764329 RepID=A0ABR7K2Z4_9FIRM|nr:MULTISPECIES: TetM/TetW/TetO/TetS family tetracycline resistance ribosomal protection protein [Paeniclostridium]MBC6003472.1 TetM/TetW/TetO/TetS family tetracycline resistance ribosomal protection protein [Paeniclostridium hominis]